jgi:hypothetical protein
MKPGTEIFLSSNHELFYEWNEFHVYRNEDGEYYADNDNGCSCDYYEKDEIIWESCKPMTRQEVVTNFTEWANGFMRPLTWTRELERLLKSLKNI